MPIVAWRDEYSVNVQEVDAQHQKMLEHVNDLHAAVESCIEKRVLKELLVALVEYTRMHFSTEEKLMKKYDYPNLKKHSKDHRVLLQHLDNLVHVVSTGKNPTFYSDYDVSTDWALNHIIKHDKVMGEFLNSRDIY